VALNVETAKATLDCARADVGAELDRARSLDLKLTQIAAFSGLTLSISGTLGGTVLVAGRLPGFFEFAAGTSLGLGVALLFVAIASCFHGLFPKGYEGISLSVARDRVRPSRLSQEPAHAVGVLASTYYTAILPPARRANVVKVGATKQAYKLVGSGLLAVVVGLLLIIIGALT
jgi:hypothetical protein